VFNSIPWDQFGQEFNYRFHLIAYSRLYETNPQFPAYNELDLSRALIHCGQGLPLIKHVKYEAVSDLTWAWLVFASWTISTPNPDNSYPPFLGEIRGEIRGMTAEGMWPPN
jgi:hypothetical protein